VALIEDHLLFRFGLRELLECARIEVVGEAATGETGLNLVQRLTPDVAIVDLRLPRMSGGDVTRRIRELAPSTQVLVLTVSGDETDVIEAVLAGASGYLLKDASPAEIVQAVHAVGAGDSMASPRAARAIFDGLRTMASSSRVPTASPLSEREKEVLRQVVDGKSNAAIAQRLVISPYTVRHHLSSILLKLHVDSRLEAAVHAVRDSLV
jgi:NarL family two-component system response regulator LiaR